MESFALYDDALRMLLPVSCGVRWFWAEEWCCSHPLPGIPERDQASTRQEKGVFLTLFWQDEFVCLVKVHLSCSVPNWRVTLQPALDSSGWLVSKTRCGWLRWAKRADWQWDKWWLLASIVCCPKASLCLTMCLLDWTWKGCSVSALLLKTLKYICQPFLKIFELIKVSARLHILA